MEKKKRWFEIGPVQSKRNTDNRQNESHGPKTKADAKECAGEVYPFAQHRGDGDEELKDPRHLAHWHIDKEEAAHPLVQVVVQAEKPFGPGENFKGSCFWMLP